MSETRNFKPLHSEIGIAWEWTYFADQEEAEAFHAYVREQGYRTSGLVQTTNEFEIKSPYGKVVVIPAGSWRVHWRAYGPG